MAASNNTSGGGGESSDGGSGTAKPPGSALVQWTEVPHFPGMVCSLSQSTSTPVVMFFKPDVILVHELRALSSKSKVRKEVVLQWSHLPVTSSCNVQLTIGANTHVVMLVQYMVFYMNIFQRDNTL